MSASERHQIKPFNQNHIYKYFHLLRVNFWDTNEEITKNYKILEDLQLTIPKAEKNNEQNRKESLQKSYDTLSNLSEKKSYLTFLYYNYILSQPYSLSQLKENFSNKVFPYYLFTIIHKTKTYWLVIDFINLDISIEFKDKIIHQLSANDIHSIEVQGELILINNPVNSRPTCNTLSTSYSMVDNSLTIQPEFKGQIEFIEALLQYLLKINELKTQKKLGLKNEPKKRDFAKADDNASNNFEILKDDLYIPSGVILKATVLKQHSSQIMGKSKRYCSLGSSQLIIFKDEAMSMICNVIPIIPFQVLITFNEETFMIKFIMENRTQVLNFSNIDEFNIWKSTLMNIIEGKLIESIEEKALIEISLENSGNNLAEHLDNIDKEISQMNKKIEELIKKKKKFEEKCKL